MDIKNNLIEINDNIFHKISKFFKKLYIRIFHKNNYNLLKETNDNNMDNIYINDIQNTKQKNEKADIEKMLYEYIDEDYQLEEYNYEEDKNYSEEKNKEKFFKLYSDIKKHMRTIDSLNTIELIQINAILKEEQRLKVAKN